MSSGERIQLTMVQVNKAILYAALLSSGGFALSSWPPDHWSMETAAVVWSWRLIAVLTLVIALRVVDLILELEGIDWRSYF